jgi:hypothetical protein
VKERGKKEEKHLLPSLSLPILVLVAGVAWPAIFAWALDLQGKMVPAVDLKAS